MKIIELFQNNVSENEKNALQKAMLQSNISRARGYTLIIMLIEGVMMLIDAGAWLLRADPQFSFAGYFFLYLAMMLVSFLFYIYSSKAPKPGNSQQMRRTNTVLIAYVVFTMCWGSVVSLYDQRLYGHVIVYMVNMITMSALFYLDNRQILLPYLSSAALLLVGLPFFQHSRDVLVGHYFNSALFTAISFVVSRILFASFVRDFRSGELLKSANEKLQNEILYNRIANNELVAMNRRLQEITMVDELTGIPNRRSLQSFFDLTGDFYAQGQAQLSVIMIDIDHFKAYNDYYGHLEGDKALKSVARALYAQHRNSDFVARFGGEEFVFASFNTPSEIVGKIAERMRASVAALKIPHAASAGEKYLTISLGTCTRVLSDRDGYKEVLRLADEALYKAKSTGRNRVENC